MAPVVRELERHSDRIIGRVCVTAQHRQMLDQVLELFGMMPDYDLNVMQESQSPTRVASTVLAGLEPILESERPDWVLVQGDTTTTMAASLAAFYSGARVGHIEAGLRSFDRHQPFPEEVNRRVASVAADMHFAPTSCARDNLLREDIAPDTILVTGNTVIDALLMAADLPYDPLVGPLSDVPWERDIVLVTAHRRENFGQPLERICLALRDIA
jgi:UDP-N-acetylglucosamine 2-epimerase (non-hydrolysing)